MPSEELRSPRLSANLVRALQQPLALDLTAAYAMMRDDALLLVGRAAFEGWTPEEVLRQIDARFVDPGSGLPFPFEKSQENPKT